MVKKLIYMCRAHGIPTIDGAHYFRSLEREEGGWHFMKTEPNMAQLRRMIEEARNMLYGVFPHGCFAKLVGLPSPGAAPPAEAPRTATG